MSFSQMIALCVGGQSATDTFEAEFGGLKLQTSQKERYETALRHFDSVVEESARIQDALSESSKLLKKSSSAVIVCLKREG